MEYEDKLVELRKEYKDKPWKRQIILRQVKALEYSLGTKQIQIKTLPK